MRILAYDYKFEAITTPMTNLKNMGTHDSLGLTITICTSMLRQHQESTVFHEIIESVNWQLGLGLSEQKILALEVGIYNTLHNAGVDLDPLMKELDRQSGRKE